jgi:hypothetical protein
LNARLVISTRTPFHLGVAVLGHAACPHYGLQLPIRQCPRA